MGWCDHRIREAPPPPQKKTVLFGKTFPNMGGRVVWLIPKPTQKKQIVFFDLNFGFCVPKSHKNPN